MASIKEKDLKAVFAKSGNKCAFPDCNQKIVNDDNKLMGQLAHIEAQSELGPRYNYNQTDSERNSADNLICLCRNHHHEIDSYPEKYTVSVLKKMKENHEKTYGHTMWNFDYLAIKKANQELNEYLMDMKNVNKNNKEILKRTINPQKSFSAIIKDMKSSIKYIEELTLELIEFDSTLDEKIIKHLKKLGYETTLWENQDYSENPFICNFWESLAIGNGNHLESLKINITLIEVLYYSLKLSLNPNDKLKKQLEIAKKRFEKMCETATHID